MTHQCQSTSRSVWPSPRPPRPRAPQCGPARFDVEVHRSAEDLCRAHGAARGQSPIVPARALAEFEASYPNVRDGSDAVARDWGVTGLPETFFVDRRGRVVAHVIGAIASDQLQDSVRAAIRGRPIGARQGGDRRSTR
jgi:cytochrome c biogenesis protein CcmG/thiol:disulfide interchange protein DsbE